METDAKELSGGRILRYIAGNRESNIDIPNDKDLIVAGLDANWVAGESLEIVICTVRGASFASGPAVGSSAQPVAAPAKPASTAVKIALIVLAQFVRPSHYDDRGGFTFCIRRSARLPVSFAASAP
jgi:hypothetical protein